MKHRVAAMEVLYRSGWVMDEIGEAFDLSRERVRQLLSKTETRKEDGGAHVKAAQSVIERDTRKKSKRDARAQKYYGCDYETIVKLNSGDNLSRTSSLAHAYTRQRINALHRHIRWEITFPEWCEVWDQSGHWAERGRSAQSYVMARRGDSGPYRKDNVYICRLRENSSDSFDSKPAEIRMATAVRRESQLIDGLTPRTHAVYTLYKQNTTISVIAEQLGISKNTVAQYLNTAKRIKGDFASLYGEAA